MAKTTITPKLLYENRNTSDVFNRLVIMGVLRILNQLLKYTLVWEDSSDGILEVTIPFFFDFSGGSGSSEKFILDNYLQWTDDECTTIGMKKMDGDYKPMPYGVVTLESTQIDSGNISNKFVMGKYLKKIGNELKSFVSFLYSIPLTINMNVNVGCDNINTMWKIEEAFRATFYKNKTFHINYKGTIVPCRIGFPESVSETKNGQYTFGQLSTDGTPDIKLQWGLTIETYLPVFDPYNELPFDLTISGFKGGILLLDLKDKQFVLYKGDEVGKIVADTTFADLAITTELDILLKWKFLYNRTDLLEAEIVYQEEGDENYEVIDRVQNHNFYHLEIEDTFVDNPVMIDVIIPNNEDCIVVNLPKIKFYCDPETNIVSESTCTIVDKGFIITDREYIDAIASYENDKGKTIDKAIKINIKNNAIDEEDPVLIEDFVYTKEYNYKKIKLFVRDHFNPEIICPFQGDDEWIKVF